MENNQVLPGEMMDEIMLRLPAKALLRFKVVSHAWNTIISSPSFIKSYQETNHNSKKVMLYTTGPVPKIYSFSLNPIKGKLENILHDFGHCGNEGDYIIEGSYGGLVLVSTPDTLCIWNSFTRQYRHLPLPTEDDEETRYGFGSASDNYSNYKLLRIQRMSSEEKICSVSWYTIGTNSWSKKSDIPYFIMCDSGALVNGKLHFNGWNSDEKGVIIAFDIGDEDFREIPEPDCKVDCLVSYNSVFELNGKLCVTSEDDECLRTYVWVMKEYGEKESWTNMFSINTVDIIIIIPLHLDLDGAYFFQDNVVFYVDSKNQEERIMFEVGCPRNNRYFATVYVETLISPNVI